MAEAKILSAEDMKERICETHYFLKRMVENRNDLNLFKLNFSAFLAAFDGIWDFMNRELRALKLEGYNKNLQEWGTTTVR